jgi:hypothetical protein
MAQVIYCGEAFTDLADKTLKDKFSALATMRRDGQVLEYDILWHNAPDAL